MRHGQKQVDSKPVAKAGLNNQEMKQRKYRVLWFPGVTLIRADDIWFSLTEVQNDIMSSAQRRYPGSTHRRELR